MLSSTMLFGFEFSFFKENFVFFFFETFSENGLFATKRAILGFLCLLKRFIFVVFGDFEWALKRTISQNR